MIKEEQMALLKIPHRENSNHGLEPTGKIELSEQEWIMLAQQCEGAFEPHPDYSGVEIMNLNLDTVPTAIQAMINKVQGIITHFVAIKISAEVPLHQHPDNSEVYFGGENGTVELSDASKELIGRYSLAPNVYSVANTGDWHRVTNQSAEPIIFFGVKYSTG